MRAQQHASIAHVPVRDVLPLGYGQAEDRLRSLGRQLELHRVAVGRTAWYWHPQHREPPPVGSCAGEYLLILDAGVTFMSTGADWLELALELAWVPELTVNASVEVACWCRPNHNVHEVRDAQWPVTGVEDLISGFAAAVAMLTDVLDEGPYDPSAWRIRAGLPDAPTRTNG